MQSKQIWMSKTMWAGLIMLVLGILNVSGVVVNEAAAEEAPTAGSDLIVGIIEGLSGLLAIFGRLTVSKSLRIGQTTLVPMLVLTMLCMSGCFSDVQMSPEYSALLDQAVDRSVELNRRCQDGNDVDCRINSDLTTQMLVLIAEARDGISTGQ
jgi:hypothetical protein